MNLSRINLFNFQKKIIVITGSSGYLGSKLVKLYRDLNSTVYEIDFIKPKNFYKKYYYKASVDKNKIFKIIYSIVNKEKKIDVLINNGGISYFDHFLDRTNKQIYETFEKNYKTTFEIIRAYAKIHIKNKLTKCSIINVSSVYGNISPDFNIYNSKKKHNS